MGFIDYFCNKYQCKNSGAVEFSKLLIISKLGAKCTN